MTEEELQPDFNAMFDKFLNDAEEQGSVLLDDINNGMLEHEQFHRLLAPLNVAIQSMLNTANVNRLRTVVSDLAVRSCKLLAWEVNLTETPEDTPEGGITLIVCDHCATPIEPGQEDKNIGGGDFHRFCVARMGCGSVGHQLRRCSCHGGTMEDPTGLTRREAAIAAYYMNIGRHHPAVPMNRNDPALHRIFHELWTEAVRSELPRGQGYNKSKWMEFEQMLFDRGYQIRRDESDGEATANQDGAAEDTGNNQVGTDA